MQVKMHLFWMVALAVSSPDVASDQAACCSVRQPWAALVFTAMGFSFDGPSESSGMF